MWFFSGRLRICAVTRKNIFSSKNSASKYGIWMPVDITKECGGFTRKSINFSLLEFHFPHTRKLISFHRKKCNFSFWKSNLDWIYQFFWILVSAVRQHFCLNLSLNHCSSQSVSYIITFTRAKPILYLLRYISIWMAYITLVNFKSVRRIFCRKCLLQPALFFIQCKVLNNMKIYVCHF